MQLSVAVRNARADAFETAIGTSPKLRGYNGTMPADVATSNTGTLLAEGALPSDWMAAASSGSKALTGTWTMTGQSGAGAGLDMTYYRIYDSAGTTCHAQGLISQAWAASAAYSLNKQVHLGGNVYKCTTAGTSASSGGPTGTGTGITDGTAVWAYVGPLGMGFDNTNIANAQSTNVNTFTLTEGGA